MIRLLVIVVVCLCATAWGQTNSVSLTNNDSAKLVSVPTSKIETIVTTNWTTISNVMCEVQIGRVLTQSVHVLIYKGKRQQLVLEETNGPSIGIKFEPVPLGPGRAYTTEIPPPLPTMQTRTRE